MFKAFSGIVLLLFGTTVSASTINGGDLLDQAGAALLESWLGIGPSTFTNIYDGTAGATSSGWHATVNGIDDTISIYDVIYNGEHVRLGGYRSTSWDGFGTYESDPSAFIFNLDSGYRLTQDGDYAGSVHRYSVIDLDNYFPTFGGGHDLFGGFDSLGSSNGYVNGSYSYSNVGLGTARDDPNLLGNLGSTPFQVTGLETYTFAPSPVPVPAAFWLFGSAFLGLVTIKKRKSLA